MPTQGLADPVIFVPGITATYLRDDYTLPPEGIWAVLRKDFERSALHPDRLGANVGKSKRSYEAREPARVLPGQLYEIAYKELVEELRYNLSPRPEHPVPVYPFGYDWRQPLEVAEDALAEFVEEVIERTRLMRHYHEDGYDSRRKVTLIGHSMGGLVIAGYLARHGGKRIGKVASLASPFQGSFEAVIKVTTGTANLGTEPPSSREREAARVTPALYYLIPSFASGLQVPDGWPRKLFDEKLWQGSIVDTIASYIRLHGVAPGSESDRKTEAKALFAAMLKAAQRHRRRLDRLKLADVGLAEKDWLCIIGTHATTRVRLEVVAKGSGADFSFRSHDRADEWNAEDPAARRFTGDGTVPFEGALPKFLPYEQLVCLTPDDYGYWELQDKAATKFGGFHGILPNMNLIHRILVRHLTGRPDKHGNTWGRPAPGVEAWDPPLSLRNKAD